MSEKSSESLNEININDTELDSSDLSSDNECSEKIKINITPTTQNYTALHIQNNKKTRSFVEEINNDNLNTDSNFKISKNIKKSLEYLRQLTKEDLGDLRKLTLKFN